MDTSPSTIAIKEGTLEEVVALSLKIPEFIDPHPMEEYQNRLQHTPRLVLVAYADQTPVGFKVGYEREGYFYSWMGAVLPAYRRHHAATLLAEAQEDWAVQQGYPHVTFKTRNYLKSMLLFALKRGFYILAVEKRDKVADYRILLRKFLDHQKC